jgi:serine/threonine protein kinase
MTSSAFARLCPGCFAEKGNASICPHCGYDESQKRGPLVLPHRTLLHQGQYLIGKVLGKPGGFGITYLALDTKLETKVAIKEYLPRDLAGRDGDHATISAHSADDAEHFRYGLTQFLQEARTLARFDHANIVRVRNFFEENGTGYLVMDYYDGITLADYLTQQPQGKLPEKTAVDILMPILDGLREVHAKNFLHRDIKPQNIYLTTGNRAILLDFGAARQAMSERSRSLSVVLSEGYAPYEQYHRRGEQGPWTDIYACAAVLYHAVAGAPPPPATERVSKDELDLDALGVSASLANALRLGLAVDHKNRPQTMAEFQGLLLDRTDPTRTAETKSIAAKVAPRPIEPSQGNKPPGLRKWLGPIALGLVAFAAVRMIMTVPNQDENKPVSPNLASAPLAVATASDRYSTVGRYPITDCVKDKRTGLTWEGKPANGERSSSQTYTNYGDQRSGDTSAYVDSVNAMRLCGYSDWRLPTKDELAGLVVKGVRPTIDSTWFPNTQASGYWSASIYAGSAAFAWGIDFGNGNLGNVSRNNSGQVRLVRDGNEYQEPKEGIAKVEINSAPPQPVSVAATESVLGRCKVIDKDIADTYIGECKNGLAHGQGLARGRDEYQGNFSEGYQDGFGIYLWGDNSEWPTERYEGWWIKGDRKNVFGVKSIEINSSHSGLAFFQREGKIEGNRYVVRGLWNGNNLVRKCNTKEECLN